MERYHTPGIDEVFDLYVAYGYVESLVRGRAREVTLIPALVPGETVQKGYYTVKGDGNLREGLIDALEEMILLHYAIGNYRYSREGVKVISDTDFSAGANVNNAYWEGVPNCLKEILLRILNNKSLKRVCNSKGITIPLTLMPSAGKFLPKRFGMEGQNPIKAKTEKEILSYALAWIGFHYYTPYLKYSKNKKNWVHIYQVAPQRALNLVDLLTLKDLKKHSPHYYEDNMDYLSNRRLALFYHLLHTESLGAIETITRKSLVMRSYTLWLDESTHNQAIRSYGEKDIGKLMDFLWELKRRSTYHTVRFFDALLRKESEAVIAIIDAVLNHRPEGLYCGLRMARRAGIIPPQSVVEGMEAFIDET